MELAEDRVRWWASVSMVLSLLVLLSVLVQHLYFKDKFVQ